MMVIEQSKQSLSLAVVTHVETVSIPGWVLEATVGKTSEEAGVVLKGAVQQRLGLRGESACMVHCGADEDLRGLGTVPDGIYRERAIETPRHLPMHPGFGVWKVAWKPVMGTR